MPGETKSFWTSLPGILSGLAAVITAAGGVYIALRSGGPSHAGGGESVDTRSEEPAETAPEDSLLVVSVHAGGRPVCLGFLSPRGKVIAFDAWGDQEQVDVSWIESGRERRARARVVRSGEWSAPYLGLLDVPGLGAPSRPPGLRNSSSLRAGEEVECYVAPHDRTPGEVLETRSTRSIGSPPVELRDVLVTTEISGKGQAGAPVIDEDGNVVAVLIGGGRGETISVAIENLKVAFPEAF